MTVKAIFLPSWSQNLTHSKMLYHWCVCGRAACITIWTKYEKKRIKSLFKLNGYQRKNVFQIQHDLLSAKVLITTYEVASNISIYLRILLVPSQSCIVCIAYCSPFIYLWYPLHSYYQLIKFVFMHSLEYLSFSDSSQSCLCRRMIIHRHIESNK